MGRPPLPKSQLRSVKVFFRVTPALHKALVAAAKRQDKPLGKYINDTLEQAVKGDR
ncbi:MAG: toxin-antitoxin system HicB family antitoxin [Sedimentisphaerales bacterium]|nr:toxin-antitoxin system HicB family antitoxin [Sedimentisphaerales bacterium]